MSILFLPHKVHDPCIYLYYTRFGIQCQPPPRGLLEHQSDLSASNRHQQRVSNFDTVFSINTSANVMQQIDFDMMMMMK